jgi:hypothetical protein
MSGWFTTRYRVRFAVGVLWMLAGGLQLQSFMFTTQFADDVLGSAALSQPAPLHDTITSIQHLVGDHPAAWNWPFALVELTIGAGMVFGGRSRVARVACLASVAWGLGVWLFGEGAGAIFTGTASITTGAPGAALLYGLLTVAAWPRARGADGALAGKVLSSTWIGVWASGALFACLPHQWGPAGLGAQASMGAMMSPSWAVAPTNALTRWLVSRSDSGAAAISAAMVTVHVLVAAAIRLRGSARQVLMITGIAVAATYWVFGQGFGGVSTGTATDVGTGPLIMVLGCALLWVRPGDEPSRSPARAYEHEETRTQRDSGDGHLVGARRLQLVVEELNHANHELSRSVLVER